MPLGISGFDPGFDPGYDLGFDPDFDTDFDPGFVSGFDPGFDRGVTVHTGPCWPPLGTFVLILQLVAGNH